MKDARNIFTDREVYKIEEWNEFAVKDLKEAIENWESFPELAPSSSTYQ